MAAIAWRTRHRLLSKIRAEWGRPRDRLRKMAAIAEYHYSRVGPPASAESDVDAGAGEGASGTANAGEGESAGRGEDARASADVRGSLDSRTWTDLDLDAVFAAIDRTESTVGQQVLYHRLRTAPVAGNLDAFEALVNRLGADTALRERMQMALARLQNPHGYDLWWLAQPDAILTRPWQVIFPLLTLTALFAIALAPYWHGALLVLIFTGTISLIVRATTAWQVGPFVGPFRQVGALVAAADTLRCLQGADIDPIVSCLSEHVPHLRRVRQIAGWVGRDPIALGELASSLFEYLNLLLLLDVNAMYFGARELRARGAQLLRVIEAVGEVDAAISVASLRAGLREGEGWTRPRVRPAGAQATLTAIRHPLIERAVPNSITLGPPHGVLVTGSNMSGKSTFLRTVGVNAVLAQTINTCFAAGYEAPIFRVRTCIGRSDDLQAGKSYYIAEVEAVLALVRASGSTEPHLFLFDELFRGTNAVERIAAAEAVLAELIVDGPRIKPHVVITATHDGELVDLLRDSYSAYHFADALGPGGLIFEYWLEPGPATTRNAIALLGLHGASNGLVNRALVRAAALDQARRVVREPEPQGS